MSNRNQRHVTRRPDGDWQVIKPHASRASAVEPTQSAAIDRAREILENDGGGELVTTAPTAGSATPTRSHPPTIRFHRAIGSDRLRLAQIALEDR